MRTLWHYLRWQLGVASPRTQTTLAERDCLARHVAGRRRVVEVGVWHGVTTSRLLQAMAPDGVLYAVDPYPPGRLRVSLPQRVARATVRAADRGRVRWVRETGADAGRRFGQAGERPIDFIFIDGDHSYEGLRGDWEAWSPRVAVGGVVALHDSRSWGLRQIDDAGSVRFTRDVISSDARFQHEEWVDSLTLVRRIE